MVIKDYKDDKGQDKEPAEQHSHGDKEDACRCKKTAAMKPSELLKLMISDLAFWKKGKKEQN